MKGGDIALFKYPKFGILQIYINVKSLEFKENVNIWELLVIFIVFSISECTLVVLIILKGAKL